MKRTGKFRCARCHAALVHTDSKCPTCGHTLSQSDHPPVPRCSLCGAEIQSQPGSELEDLLAHGISVVVLRSDPSLGPKEIKRRTSPGEDEVVPGVRKGAGLDATRYLATLCKRCNRIACNACHPPWERGIKCPACGGELAPLNTDALRQWSARQTTAVSMESSGLADAQGIVREHTESGGDIVTIRGGEWAGALWADKPVRAARTFDVASFMAQPSLPPVWPEDERYRSYVANDRQRLQNQWITVFLHHPNADVIVQTLWLPHIECVGPIVVSIADILVHGDQSLAKEAAQAVWRLSDYGMHKVFNVILSRGMTPSDYSAHQVSQTLALLGNECPAERRELLKKELRDDTSTARLDQPQIFLEVVQDHLKRMKQVGGIRPFVRKELEKTWVLEQIVARAVEKMSLTLKDGEIHSSGFTFGEDSKHFMNISTIPVAMHDAADWYAHKSGGYLTYLRQIEINLGLILVDPKVFVHFIFGIEDSGFAGVRPWVTCGLFPLWQKDFVPAMFPTDCLTADERRDLDL